MKCSKCSANIVLANSKFCPECGAKVEPLKPTAPRRESFSGVRGIIVGLGTDFKIMPSNTDETTIVVDGPEEIKQSLSMKLRNGVLDIHGPSDSVNISVNNINGGNISVAGRGIFVRGSISGSVITGDNVFIGGDAPVSVSILTPPGVDVSIDTNGGVDCEVGDVRSNISVDTSGGLTFNADCITGFDADVSGSVNANINRFEDGICNLDVSGSCNLNAPSGHIEKLIVDVSGSCNLNVNAQTDKAVLDVSGSLRGNLRADIVRKDVSGRDTLNVIR
jgi:hypothetical protein